MEDYEFALTAIIFARKPSSNSFWILSYIKLNSVGRLGLLAKEAVLQSPKKNMTGRRRKLIFNPQEIQEYDQKPLYQYIQNIYLLPSHFPVF